MYCSILSTSPVLRGKKLEPIIFMKTAKYLRKTYGMQSPLYVASPDGTCGDFIIEIKCTYTKEQ